MTPLSSAAPQVADRFLAAPTLDGESRISPTLDGLLEQLCTLGHCWRDSQQGATLIFFGGIPVNLSLERGVLCYGLRVSESLEGALEQAMSQSRLTALLPPRSQQRPLPQGRWELFELHLELRTQAWLWSECYLTAVGRDPYTCEGGSALQTLLHVAACCDPGSLSATVPEAPVSFTLMGHPATLTPEHFENHPPEFTLRLNLRHTRDLGPLLPALIPSAELR